jgi:hypothetical protein
MQIVFLVVWFLYIRQCAYWGSERVIGARDAVLYGLIFNYVGMLFIFSLRKIK